MKFKLTSEYKPTGDQPQAIDKLTQSCLQSNPHQTLMGVTGSGKTFTLANVIQNLNLPTLIISHNKTLAGQLYQEFRDFFPENAVSYFVSYYDYYQPEAYLPSTDTYIEKETNINDEIDKLRLGTTASLLTRPDVIVVASVSCIYNLGSPVEYGRNFVELIEGQLIERDTLVNRLIDMQYSRSDYELRRGSIRVRGDVVTVWPADLSHALKMSFIENRIESITPIDPLTGNPVTNQSPSGSPENLYGNHLPRYVIYPAKHYQTNRQGLDTALKAIKKDLAEQINYFKSKGKIVEAYRIGQRVKHDLEMLSELGYVNGIENYSRYFDGRKPGDPPFSLLDYFQYNALKVNNPAAKISKQFLTIIDESHITLPQLRGMYHGDQARKQTLIDFGFRLPSALDNRPLQFSEIQNKLSLTIYASATPDDWELGQSRGYIAEQLIRPTGLVDPDIEIRPITGQIQDLVIEIIKRKAVGERVLVTTLTKKTAEALTDYLNDQEKIDTVVKNAKLKLENYPKVQYLHADVETLDRQDILDNLRSGDFDVVVGINLLREGLDLPEVSLVAVLEADKEGFLRSRTSLIQTMGRAARHINGHVILYADVVTKSIKAAIDEVTRRRHIQLQYNQKHGITPQTIQKPIREKLLIRAKDYDSELSPERQAQMAESFDISQLTPKDKKEQIKKFTKLMNQAAKDWQFERAAKYRDLVNQLKETL